VKRIDGLGAWVWQRLSALYLAVFVIYLIGNFLNLDRFDHATWVAWVSHPVNNILMIIGFCMLVVHAWIGIKDVIMDYIHPVVVRAVVMMLFALILLLCLVWALRVVLMV